MSLARICSIKLELLQLKFSGTLSFGHCPPGFVRVVVAEVLFLWRSHANIEPGERAVYLQILEL